METLIAAGIGFVIIVLILARPKRVDTDAKPQAKPEKKRRTIFDPYDNE